ncbi:MAG TPA: DUF366 family protein [bacterium]|nr:DUF366 family protein [bacterium]
MKSFWLDRQISYDGTQLSSHWIYGQCGALGDAVASFEGPADVPISNMADLVDVRENSPIFSRSMLHFIAEHFDGDLALAVARQRLLVAAAADLIRPGCRDIRRCGNDLYSGEKKLSVSIATASPVSTLIHFGINIDSEGTPVPTLGLRDIGMDHREIARRISEAYAEEIDSMDAARCKVRAVR